MANARPLAFITGAASGLGAETARLLAQAGYDLVLGDLNADSLASVQSELSSLGSAEVLVGDVAAGGFPAAFMKVLAGRKLSAVVHCAGISPTMGDPSRILAVNLEASVSLIDLMSEVMQESSAIVLLASTAGHLVGTALDDMISSAIATRSFAAVTSSCSSPEMAYAVSKRGVQLLARNRALAFGRRGVRINSVSPGIIDTPMGRQEMAHQPMIAAIINNAPIQRAARVEEVAAVATFLCGPGAGYIAGTDILVDGGSQAGNLSSQAT